MNYKLEGNGKAMVFIHGLSDNLLYWEFLAGNLKHDYQVLRVDLRGHGESELGDGEITIDTYVDDLHNLLEELNISKVNLIGFSLGSAVAIDFTVKYPQNVESLVLMSGFYKVEGDLRNTMHQFRNNLEILCPDVIDDNVEELELLKELSSQNANTKAYVKAVDACLNFDAEKDLLKINIPTLLLAGKYDDISTLDIQKDLHVKIKNSKLIVFNDVKHNLLVGKNNEKILNILKEFFN